MDETLGNKTGHLSHAVKHSPVYTHSIDREALDLLRRGNRHDTLLTDYGKSDGRGHPGGVDCAFGLTGYPGLMNSPGGSSPSRPVQGLQEGAMYIGGIAWWLLVGMLGWGVAVGLVISLL